MNIHYHSYGNQDALPLVFFHGWGFDSQIWRSLIPLLSPYYQLILVDLPGFGRTSMMPWADFKSQIMSQLPAKFAVVGWSMGGLFATRLAIELPGRVTHLLNITSSPRFITESDWPGVSRDVFVGFYKNLNHDINTALRDFIHLQLHQTSYEYIPELLPSFEGLQSGLDVLDSWDLRDALHELNLPVCYMFGRLDPITSSRTMRAMQHIYPDFKYVLFHKSAHMPFISDSELFIQELGAFIR